MNVTPEDLLLIIGNKEVTIAVLQKKLEDATRRIVELENPKDKEPAPEV